MIIKALIDKRFTETELHVCKDRADAEVRKLLGELHTFYDRRLMGTDEAGNHCSLKPGELMSFYAERQRVFALDEKKRYRLSCTLSELEKEYEGFGFVRISRSELVSLNWIKELDLSVTGTIRVIMKNGYETYASRRNVGRLKQWLMENRGRIG